MKHNNLTILFYATMWFPILFTLGLTTHCILLFCGINSAIVKGLFYVPPLGTALFYFLSRWMQFCNVHKCLIVYVFIVNICILLQHYNFFGDAVNIVRIAVFIVGSVLLILTCLKLYEGVSKGEKPLEFYCPNFRSFVRR